MKLNLLILFLFGLLCCSLAASVGAGDEEAIEEGDEDMTDQEFDEIFLGKKLGDLSDEEAAEEVRELVALIDRDGDGQLDKEELIAYQIRLTEHNNNQHTKRVFKKNDEDGDGLVSFEETWMHGEEGQVPAESEMTDEQRTLKAKFTSADANGDGSLDVVEFGAFVHPQRHDHMVQHLVQDQLHTYDKNGDGEIGRKEFLAAFNPEGLDEDDLPEWVGDEKANFDYNLDKDQNGRLDEDEIRQWMVPDDATMFDVEARHLFYNADSNKDRKLTAEELLERFDILVDSSITNNGYAVHEEL